VVSIIFNIHIVVGHTIGWMIPVGGGAIVHVAVDVVVVVVVVVVGDITM
jgi:hypothetical protein